jgi:hypothetical protein
MFVYTYDGLPVSRAAMVAAFGGRKLTDVIELIAFGNGSYNSGAFRVVFVKGVG